MNANKKNTVKAKVVKASKYPLDREKESQYITVLAKEQARLEDTLKFKFLAKNKNLAPHELAGVIMEVVNVNGVNIHVTTNITEADAKAFLEDKLTMLFA